MIFALSGLATSGLTTGVGLPSATLVGPGSFPSLANFILSMALFTSSSAFLFNSEALANLASASVILASEAFFSSADVALLDSSMALTCS